MFTFITKYLDKQKEHETKLKALEARLGIEFYWGGHNKPHYRKKRVYEEKQTI